jgi:hypothetical protein
MDREERKKKTANQDEIIIRGLPKQTAKRLALGPNSLHITQPTNIFSNVPFSLNDLIAYGKRLCRFVSAKRQGVVVMKASAGHSSASRNPVRVSFFIASSGMLKTAMQRDRTVRSVGLRTNKLRVARNCAARNISG